MSTSRVVPLLLGATLVAALIASCERSTGPVSVGQTGVSADRIGPLDTLPPDTTPPDTTPPDTTPPDTTPPDTIPPDTIPPDTIPPDTIPPDTIPPDTTPPPPPPPPPGPPKGGVVQSATGSGHLTVGGDFRSFTFTSVKRAGGRVTGEFEFFSRSANLRVHGDVVCLEIIGNRAWMGGITRNTSNPALAAVGSQTAWRVADNGEGKTAPDQTSLMFVNQPPGFAQAYCNARPPVPPLNPIEKGNIQVRDKMLPGDTLP